MINKRLVLKFYGGVGGGVVNIENWERIYGRIEVLSGCLLFS